jgi:hypothetical protein
MVGVNAPSLRDSVANALAPRYFWDRTAAARFTDLDRVTFLGNRLTDLVNRSILIATASQLTTALALIELDGIAGRLVVLPPDAGAAPLADIIAAADVDTAVIDDGTPADSALDGLVCVTCFPSFMPLTAAAPRQVIRTEWVLMTSGTSGVPKMVTHDLASLTAAVHVLSPADGAVVWGTFLRHPPLRRLANLSARGARWRFARFFERRRASQGPSRPSGEAQRHPSVRHAVAMAPRLDEPCDSDCRTPLRAPVRRNRRPGNSRQPSRRISASCDRSRLCFDRGRRRLRCQ